MHIVFQALYVHFRLHSEHFDKFLFSFNFIIILLNLTDNVLPLYEMKSTFDAVRGLRSFLILIFIFLCTITFLSAKIYRRLSRGWWDYWRRYRFSTFNVYIQIIFIIITFFNFRWRWCRYIIEVKIIFLCRVRNIDWIFKMRVWIVINIGSIIVIEILLNTFIVLHCHINIRVHLVFS